MDKLFTLKKSENSLKNEINQEGVAQLGEDQFQPSDGSIQFLLNYSKALATTKTDSLGDVFTILN